MDNNDAKVLESLLNTPPSGRILSKSMGQCVEACYSGDSPPCSCVCPLGLDVATFNKRLQKGNFNSAYTMFRDQVLLPAIVCELCDEPCASACIRKDIDEPLSMKHLEKAAVNYTQSTAPIKYRFPAKGKKAAIIGAGLSGLSCAIKLASHGYNVTLLEKSNQIGGKLWDLLPPGLFLDEIKNQMQYLNYELKLNTKIENIDELIPEFDAVLIATGKEGESFGLLHGLNRDSLGSIKKGIFLAGSLIGATPIQSIEQGIRAAQSIESYLQTNRMHEMMGINRNRTTRLKVNKSMIEPQKRVESETFTKEEAIRESSRCNQCDCEDCLLICEMMQWYQKKPKRIVSDVRMTLNPVKGMQPRVATRMLSSCSDCGLCKTVCLEKIDLGEFLSEARRIMHREGSLPLAFHDFWIRDMRFAESEKAYVARNAPGCAKSDYVFFPGCQLGGSDTAYVEKTYRYLLEKLPRTGLILSCCGIPAEWAGDEALVEEMVGKIRHKWNDMGRPVVIFACPTCRKMFVKYLPEIMLISLYDVIDANGLPADNTAEKGTVSIFDPCASRYDESMQQSVRKLVAKAGLTIEELSYSKKTAQCCGNGGHIYSANPGLAKDIMSKRAALGHHPYITYCSNCRDVFSYMGKTCRHVLDVIFHLNSDTRRPPSLTERRINRTTLKTNLLKNIWKEENYQVTQQNPTILISPEVMEKLDRQLIVEDDIRETINYCESSDNKIFHPETGCYIGHLRQGYTTYWVSYKVEEAGYRLTNAYSHRINIEGE